MPDVSCFYPGCVWLGLCMCTQDKFQGKTTDNGELNTGLGEILFLLN